MLKPSKIVDKINKISLSYKFMTAKYCRKNEKNKIRELNKSKLLLNSSDLYVRF